MCVCRRYTNFFNRVRVMDVKNKSDHPTPKPVKIEKEEFDFTAQPQSNKFVVESKKQNVADTTGEELQRDWPFKMICEHLCLDLFDPAWEIRHGAGIGLRSILKAHGEGSGKKGIHIHTYIHKRCFFFNKVVINHQKKWVVEKKMENYTMHG